MASYSIKTISLNYSAPNEFKLKEVEFNDALNLFVGDNGSGKTFILVHAFMATQIMTLVIMGASAIESAQVVINSCLKNSETFTGEFTCELSNSLSVYVKMQEGDVIVCDVNNPDSVSSLTPVCYMSSGMRLFDNIQQYLIMRKGTLKGSLTMTPEGYQILLKLFRMYDVQYIEKLINACPIILPDTIQECNFGDDYPVELSLHPNGQDFKVTTIKGNKKPATSYSAGQQAIINMFAGTQ